MYCWHNSYIIHLSPPLGSDMVTWRSAVHQSGMTWPPEVSIEPLTQRLTWHNDTDWRHEKIVTHCILIRHKKAQDHIIQSVCVLYAQIPLRITYCPTTKWSPTAKKAPPVHVTSFKNGSRFSISQCDLSLPRCIDNRRQTQSHEFICVHELIPVNRLACFA